jgi:hypothetical protein
VDRTEKNKDVAEPCPERGHPENPPENRLCGRCGASLERVLARRSEELAPRAKESRVTLSRFLPRRLGPVGKTVAAGLAVAAADVVLAWVRHRLEKTGRPPVMPHDVGLARRNEGPGGGPEYLHGYLLKEAALLLREGRETRRSYSSELTIWSSRVEK